MKRGGGEEDKRVRGDGENQREDEIVSPAHYASGTFEMAAACASLSLRK